MGLPLVLLSILSFFVFTSANLNSYLGFIYSHLDSANSGAVSYVKQDSGVT